MGETNEKLLFFTLYCLFYHLYRILHSECVNFHSMCLNLHHHWMKLRRKGVNNSGSPLNFALFSENNMPSGKKSLTAGCDGCDKFQLWAWLVPVFVCISFCTWGWSKIIAPPKTSIWSGPQSLSPQSPANVISTCLRWFSSTSLHLYLNWYRTLDCVFVHLWSHGGHNQQLMWSNAIK